MMMKKDDDDGAEDDDKDNVDHENDCGDGDADGNIFP